MTDKCEHPTTRNVDEGDDRVLRCANPACDQELSRTRKDPRLD